MTSASYIEIERYIEKQMSASEIVKFEERLKNDLSLRENYKATLATYQLITEAGRLEMKNMLASFESEIEENSDKGKVIPLWVKRAIPIAAFLIIFLAVYQFGLFNTSMSTAEVYDNNFETYEAPSNLRNEDRDLDDSWDEGSRLYREMKFEGAIEKFKKASDNIPHYMISFYSGVSSMAKKNPDYVFAVNQFDQVLNSDNDFKQQSNWYKSLALLKMNKNEDAFIILKNIVETKSYNYKKAEAILNVKFAD